ncbi:Hypothetical_protein [Hexamita inflata]|uniref:Hypothetical_protein n=1 Tax=Hexamita inflata TaxID=28002 RepID=A0AA86Q7L1_9EUKA|nr:Hypothetical protein HINF_LOCUS35257 [Hexamita inflata]
MVNCSIVNSKIQTTGQYAAGFVAYAVGNTQIYNNWTKNISVIANQFAGGFVSYIDSLMTCQNSMATNVSVTTRSVRRCKLIRQCSNHKQLNEPIHCCNHLKLRWIRGGIKYLCKYSNTNKPTQQQPYIMLKLRRLHWICIRTKYQLLGLIIELNIRRLDKLKIMYGAVSRIMKLAIRSSQVKRKQTKHGCCERNKYFEILQFTRYQNIIIGFTRF